MSAAWFEHGDEPVVFGACGAPCLRVFPLRRQGKRPGPVGSLESAKALCGCPGPMRASGPGGAAAGACLQGGGNREEEPVERPELKEITMSPFLFSRKMCHHFVEGTSK